jgi:hypothetical protein
VRPSSVSLAAIALAVGGCAAVTGLGNYTQGADAGLGDDAGGAKDLAADGGGGPQNGTDDATMPAEVPEGGTVYESGSLPDIQYDAPPACGPATCGGCCSNGACVGGGSVATCGAGGRACEDCTGMGGACTNHACATPRADAGPTSACKVSACTGCIPFYQTPCCKADQTCGCEVSFSNNCK